MRSAGRRLRSYGWMLRHLGPGWAAFRLRYALERRLGLLQRRAPAHSWRVERADPGSTKEVQLARLGRFLFDPEDVATFRPLLRDWNDPQLGAQREAAQVAAGVFRYFGHATAELGREPDWFANPFSGQRAPATQHWARIGDFGHGDIKVIWEPSRFSWAYALARAYARSGDEAHAATFWRLLEHWRRHNPPNLGPHWKCGQEVALRVMACCFGLFMFQGSRHTTTDRLARLVELIEVSGRRIDANLAYARSQRNNHGVSESVGLWTIGLLFPFLPRAAAWRERGRRTLGEHVGALVYPDGAFAQHSVNYHRVLLHDLAWALRLGERNGADLGPEVRGGLERAARWLAFLCDPVSGRVPRFGQNDGACVLPLSECDVRDYRPAAQAAGYLATGRKPFAAGPWDEELLWLCGAEAVAAESAPPPRGELAGVDGGLHGWRSGEAALFLRCGGFRHRPAQADLLHLDLWWRGLNVALDPGTFSYNAPPPWDNPLAAARYHNTVTVAEREPMERVGRFLWLPWPHGGLVHRARSAQGACRYWEGTHDGYRRLPTPVALRRGVLTLGERCWVVLDAVTSAAPQRCRLHWLLADLPWDGAVQRGQLRLDTGHGEFDVRVACSEEAGKFSLVRADPDGPRGWQAPYYATRAPALSLVCTATGPQIHFLTVFGPGPLQLETSPGADAPLQLAGDGWRATVHLGGGQGPLLRELEFRDADQCQRLTPAGGAATESNPATGPG